MSALVLSLLSIIILIIPAPAFAYACVMAEEFTHLRKSKPAILVAGILSAMVAVVYANNGQPDVAEAGLRHNLLEYGGCFCFCSLR